MIRVIREDRRAIKETTCYNCASVLEYTPADTQRQKTTDYTGDVDIYTIIVCPVCSNKVKV